MVLRHIFSSRHYLCSSPVHKMRYYHNTVNNYCDWLLSIVVNKLSWELRTQFPVTYFQGTRNIGSCKLLNRFETGIHKIRRSVGQIIEKPNEHLEARTSQLITEVCWLSSSHIGYCRAIKTLPLS